MQTDAGLVPETGGTHRDRTDRSTRPASALTYIAARAGVPALNMPPAWMQLTAAGAPTPVPQRQNRRGGHDDDQRGGSRNSVQDRAPHSGAFLGARHAVRVGAVLVSAVLVGAAARGLWRRGRRGAAVYIYAEG